MRGSPEGSPYQPEKVCPFEVRGSEFVLPPSPSGQSSMLRASYGRASLRIMRRAVARVFVCAEVALEPLKLEFDCCDRDRIGARVKIRERLIFGDPAVV